MKALKILTRLTQEKAAGPAPSFTEHHLAKAIEIIGKETTGRAKLSEAIRLGDGATRTLIDRLQTARLIRTSRRGCALTKDGLAILEELNSKLPRQAKVAPSSVTVSSHNFGILVKNVADRVRNGIEQRDAAVRAGAMGAVTLVFKRGKLFTPPADIMPRNWGGLAKRILELFEPGENDVIVIAGGDTEEKAEDGGRAAAWTLIESSN